MGKSLTDTAKSILMKEGAIPSVSSSQSDPDAGAKSMTPNMGTLRPGSRGAEGRIVNPGSTPPVGDADDLGGQTPTSGAPTQNMGARAAGKTKKDTSRSGVSAVPAEKSRQQAEIMEEEALDEDIEISEELEAFIEAMLEEGYSEEQIAEAIEENFEIVESSHEDDMKHKRMMKEAEKEKEDEDEKEKDEDEDKEDKKKMMKEHIDALLAHENLSEDFRERAEVIFESAVSVRLQEEVAVLEDAYAEALEEEVAKIRAELTEQVDDYLNYVVEQWVSENEVAIESGLRSELTEDFISGLRNLFAEHYIDIPEEKVSIVEELGSKVEALETKLNEEIDRNVSLTKMINESKQFEILVSACDGLTTTQAKKLQALAENVGFTTPEEFAAKVETLKESYFPTTVRADAVLDRVEPSDDPGKLMTEELTGPMAAYVRTLGKTVKVV